MFKIYLMALHDSATSGLHEGLHVVLRRLKDLVSKAKAGKSMELLICDAVRRARGQCKPRSGMRPTRGESAKSGCKSGAA